MHPVQPKIAVCSAELIAEICSPVNVVSMPPATAAVRLVVDSAGICVVVKAWISVEVSATISPEVSPPNAVEVIAAN